MFQQPISLPYLSATLADGGKVGDTKMNTEAYESWVSNQQSNVNSKVWLLKGKDLNHNYSSREFRGSSGGGYGQAAARDVRLIRSDNLPVDAIRDIPKTIPQTLTVEIFTKNQLLKSSTVMKDRSFLLREISSDVNLRDIKRMVIDEIVDGVARTFKLDSAKVGGVKVLYEKGLEREGSSRLDIERMELVFQYFNPVIDSWRPLADEVDWMHAKQLCMQHFDGMHLLQVYPISYYSIDSFHGA